MKKNDISIQSLSDLIDSVPDDVEIVSISLCDGVYTLHLTKTMEAVNKAVKSNSMDELMRFIAELDDFEND